jgi:hypothetical protein
LTHPEDQSACDERRDIWRKRLKKSREDDDGAADLDAQSSTEVLGQSRREEEPSDDATACVR